MFDKKLFLGILLLAVVSALISSYAMGRWYAIHPVIDLGNRSLIN
jgi:hypothetical protein